MVFSSHIFLFYFLPIFLLFTYILPFRYFTLMSTILSYGFYGWANPKWVLLMLASSYVDYFCGLALVKYGHVPMDGADLPYLPKGQPRNRAQTIALAVSIVSNISILGFFKYFDFAVSNINAVAAKLGFGSDVIAFLHIALPVGVSFYTFVSMSYAIDVYRGDARPLKNPIDYQCYVSLFPHLIAGPIIRYQTVADQIRFRTFTYEKFARGTAFFCLGMGKKVLLANPMGHIADNVFAAGGLHWQDAWYGLIAYAFQIYFDFSAYSDMAVGLALMIGFYFIKNFDDPYLAESITDLWRRWHISLSTWLRDYLYIPLGGNRLGKVRTHLNLMTVMLLGGLWHGASWNFLIWGGIHGGMLSLERSRGGRGFFRRLPRVARIALTFGVMCLSWVFFRSATLGRALEFMKSLFGAGAALPGDNMVAAAIYTPYHIASILLCALVVWGVPQTWNFTQRITPWKGAYCLAVFGLSVIFMWTQQVNPFLYFRF